MGGTILSYRGIEPKIHQSVFVADGARVIGDVEIGKDSSIWFNAVVRGDVNYIRIGEETNIQDGAVLHVTRKLYPLTVGNGVTVGHGAVLHAAEVREYCLIGMGAVVLDDAKVGPFALVAAGSVVLEHFVIPEGVLAAGVPAKVVRSLTAGERQFLVDSARNYVGYAEEYKTHHPH
ncbi:MAG TPA: gamma carbonic anhydrase family protein [Bacteroidota bacterium]|nr:gamma carbonic anhydrase family protein [Bacteroidota bacterium]